MKPTGLQEKLRTLAHSIAEGWEELHQAVAALKVKHQDFQQVLVECEPAIDEQEEAALAPRTPFHLPEGPFPHTGNSGGGPSLAQ
ncbi:MAG: hypothetical protein V3S82_01325 [Dehalococcoidia bacterium]